MKVLNIILKNTFNKYKTPNKYAVKTRIIIESKNELLIEGYQNYRINTKQNIITPIGFNALTKFNILYYFLKSNIRNNSFLDIGSNNGLFVFLASSLDAKNSTGYDIDNEYVETSNNIKAKTKFINVNFELRNFDEVSQKFDYVLFISMIHWVYNKTSFFGSLDEIIKYLSKITKKCLIIEWVSELDPKIQKHKHIQYNPKIIKQQYNFNNFSKALKKHFKKYELIGINTPTRKIYAAWK